MKNLFLLLSLIFFIACNNSSSNVNKIFNPDASPMRGGSWYTPTPLTSLHLQLQGNIATSHAVEVYDIDLFNTSVTKIQSLKNNDKKVICYFSAGSYENWRSDKDTFPSELLGNNLDGWEGEKWLDISNEALAPIMIARLDLAVAKGCDGVDPDNMDGYANNTGFDLNAQYQLGYNKFIANEARKRGLSVGLKNDVAQINELEPYYDFSLNEECHTYNECESMQPFIDANKAVFNIEYSQKYYNQNERNVLCANALNLRFETLVLPLSLDNSFRYSCQ